MTNRTRTQVYFTREQRRALDEIAEREGRTMAEVVREATTAYLTRRQRTIPLPADVAALLDSVATTRGMSPEALAVEVLRDALVGEVPRPTVPLDAEGWGDGQEAHRVDELLAEGFGTDR